MPVDSRNWSHTWKQERVFLFGSYLLLGGQISPKLASFPARWGPCSLTPFPALLASVDGLAGRPERNTR